MDAYLFALFANATTVQDVVGTNSELGRYWVDLYYCVYY